MESEKYKFSPHSESLKKNNSENQSSYVSRNIEIMGQAATEKPRKIEIETNLGKALDGNVEIVDILWTCVNCGEKNYERYCKKCGAAKEKEEKHNER